MRALASGSCPLKPQPVIWLREAFFSQINTDLHHLTFLVTATILLVLFSVLQSVLHVDRRNIPSSISVFFMLLFCHPSIYNSSYYAECKISLVRFTVLSKLISLVPQFSLPLEIYLQNLLLNAFLFVCVISYS